MEQIKFVDGTVWDVSTVKAMAQVATGDNDTLYGYAVAETISGFAGDDTVYARAGHDTLDGGAGDDQLYGEDGDDLMRGGTQNDRLEGGSGSDYLQGDEGNDALFGQAGDDTLDGGAGSDMLDGGAGNDTYRFGRGSGKDTINAYDGRVGKVEVVQMEAGILTTDVTLKREGDALVLSINGSSDTLRVGNYFYNNANGGYQVEQIKFADGSTWDVNSVMGKIQTPANAKSDGSADSALQRMIEPGADRLSAELIDPVDAVSGAAIPGTKGFRWFSAGVASEIRRGSIFGNGGTGFAAVVGVAYGADLQGARLASDQIQVGSLIDAMASFAPPDSAEYDHRLQHRAVPFDLVSSNQM